MSTDSDIIALNVHQQFKQKGTHHDNKQPNKHIRNRRDDQVHQGRIEISTESIWEEPNVKQLDIGHRQDACPSTIGADG